MFDDEVERAEIVAQVRGSAGPLAPAAGPRRTGPVDALGDEQVRELLAADLAESRAFVRRCDAYLALWNTTSVNETEHALEEAAVALRLNAGSTGGRLSVALLLDAFQRTRQALLDGVLSVPHALVLVEELGDLDRAVGLRIEGWVLSQLDEGRLAATPGQLRRRLHRRAIREDPEAVVRRRTAAKERTDVRLDGGRDGMAALVATGPALLGRVAMSLVDVLARPVGADDQRPVGQRRHAALLRALHEAAGIDVPCEIEVVSPVVTAVAKVVPVVALPEPVRIRTDQPTLTAALTAAAQHLLDAQRRLAEADADADADVDVDVDVDVGTMQPQPQRAHPAPPQPPPPPPPPAHPAPPRPHPQPQPEPQPPQQDGGSDARRRAGVADGPVEPFEEPDLAGPWNPGELVDLTQVVDLADPADVDVLDEQDDPWVDVPAGQRGQPGEQVDCGWALMEPPDLSVIDPPRSDESPPGPSRAWSGRPLRISTAGLLAQADPPGWTDPALSGRAVQLLGHGALDAHLLAETVLQIVRCDPGGLLVRRLCVDRASGRAVAVDARPLPAERLGEVDLPEPPSAVDDYRPTAAQRRVVRARDQHCTFPGCRRGASRCDLDHVVPWPLGPTSTANLHCLCRRHHRLKHQGWQVRRTADGQTHWTSPRGQALRRGPVT